MLCYNNNMMQFKKDKLIAQVTKIATFLAVFWILFLLGKSIWQNWNLRHSIWKLNEQLAQLTIQKKDLENLIIYYQSDSFKELEARKKLGLKKADEKVVILPLEPTGGPTSGQDNFSPSSSSFPEDLEKEKENIAGVSQVSKIPNWALWWQYFTR